MGAENNYLDRVYRARKVDDEELNASEERLKKPLRLIESTEDGLLTYEVGRGRFSFRLTPVDEEHKQRVRKFSDRLVKETESYHETLAPSNWHTVADVHFETDDETLDIDAIWPNDLKVFLCTFDGHDRFLGSAVYGDNKAVYLLGPLHTPRGVSILLHEVGHLVDPGLDEDRITSERNKSDLAEKYRRERAATAFQYRVLRSLIKDVSTRADLLTVTNGNDLGSHSEFITRRLALINRSILQHTYETGYGDLEEDDDWEKDFEEFLREGFNLWKKTPQFEEWQETQDIFHDDVLFGRWKQWITKNSYDYESDIEGLDE